jgi:hypothetical protein
VEAHEGWTPRGREAGVVRYGIGDNEKVGALPPVVCVYVWRGGVDLEGRKRRSGACAEADAAAR